MQFGKEATIAAMSGNSAKTSQQGSSEMAQETLKMAMRAAMAALIG